MQTIDVTALVGEELDELRRTNSSRQVVVDVGELPDCVGDPALLRQVVSNLLSNAFKFTSARQDPVVEVRGQIEGPERIYMVRDNGAGFDMTQAERLFGAFQRLHSSDQ